MSVLLVDVNNNGSVDWHKMKATGVQGAFIKATQGDSFVDPMWRHHRAAAQAEGLLVAPYHYFVGNGTAVAQAQHFIATVGGFSGLLPFALDLEIDGPQRAGVNPKAYVHSALAFLAEMRTHLPNVKPWVYSYRDFFQWLGNPTAFAAVGARLWEAAYNASPHPLAGWTTISMHQFTDQGHIAGSGGVDEDRFVGDFADLKALVIP